MDWAAGYLRNLVHARPVRRKRESSWDSSGANADSWDMAPGERRTIADISGAGTITHLWFTSASDEPFWTRRVVLRAWWDGEEQPSVEVPLGDFFGCGHGAIRRYWSAPLDMSGPDDSGHSAFNCWWPMPFGSRARLEVSNEGAEARSLYFYVDYELADEPDAEALRFHAQWRRCSPCDGWMKPGQSVGDREVNAMTNLDGAGNYVILDAEGRGHYVGCNLSIDNQRGEWWGEGDDMIFIDGDTWPPSLHGTGSEDYFCHAYGMQDTFGPFHGVSVANRDHKDWEGQWTVYRHHIPDPVSFQQRILVSIEHGHANGRSDDYSSTAYWYQGEPHKAFPPLPAVMGRLPRGATK
ncbi:MAG: glycoside hydrolase family 172 protein [Anaerolineae bacterium]